MNPGLSTRLALSVWFLVIVLSSGGTGLFSAREASAVGAEEDCGVCHEEIVASFDKTFHGRIWRGTGQHHDCQACHGDTAEHVQDPSTQNVLTYSRREGSPAHELSMKCLDCHGSDPERTMWEMSLHSSNDISCFNCHTVHASRSTVAQPAACFECHRAKKTEANKQSHHPIIETKIKCTDCHNPHGTLSHGMITADNVNHLCYQCHAEKRGPFIWEHPPVEESCVKCHTPHGSRHSKLLVEKVPNLCQDCHDWSRHPGTPYDAQTGFAGSRPSNRFFGRSCLNCHGAIHGSAHFENHRFTR
jgi:DmsE family decaheme c-type cytochrome